jgi:hypothetical protein
MPHLIKGQEILLNFAIHTLNYVEFTDFDLRYSYFAILYYLLQRGEFSLSHIGFSNLDERMAKNSQIMKVKKKIAVNFQYLIYEGLRMGIEKLARKQIDFYRRDFVVLNLAVSYFMIPEFREKFLEAVTKNPNRSYKEITHLDEEEKRDKRELIGSFFNWEEDFYSFIPDNENKKKNMEILNRTLSHNDWHEKIEKRGVAFFLIISQWAKYVQKTVVNKEIVWKDIPGYNTILRTVLAEMKERKLIEYPEALVD